MTELHKAEFEQSDNRILSTEDFLMTGEKLKNK